MSAKTFETVMSLAIGVPSFANEIFASPDQALEGFDLTEEEIHKFKNMSRVEFEIIALENYKPLGVDIKYQSHRICN